MGKSKTESTMPIDALLECIEIKNDMLVWVDGWREKFGLRKSKKYPYGKQVAPSYTPTYRVSKKSPYIRIYGNSVSYTMPYGRVVMAVKNKEWPTERVWSKDGNENNLKVSNFTFEFHPWWENKGRTHPLLIDKKSPTN